MRPFEIGGGTGKDSIDGGLECVVVDSIEGGLDDAIDAAMMLRCCDDAMLRCCCLSLRDLKQGFSSQSAVPGAVVISLPTLALVLVSPTFCSPSENKQRAHQPKANKKKLNVKLCCPNTHSSRKPRLIVVRTQPTAHLRRHRRRFCAINNVKGSGITG